MVILAILLLIITPNFAGSGYSKSASKVRDPRTTLVTVQPIAATTPIAAESAQVIALRASILTAIEIYKHEKAAAIMCSISEEQRAAARLEADVKFTNFLKQTLTTIDDAISARKS